MTSILKKMTRAELPNDGLRELSDVIGVNRVKEMLVKLPGSTYYVPKTLYKHEDKHYIETHPDKTAKEIAYDLGVSERTAYRKGCKRVNKKILA